MQCVYVVQQKRRRAIRIEPSTPVERQQEVLGSSNWQPEYQTYTPSFASALDPVAQSEVTAAIALQHQYAEPPSIASVNEARAAQNHRADDKPPDLSTTELELFHQFVMHTCETTWGPGHVATMWRMFVPQIAFKHQYLLRVMLCFAAQHLSKLRPQFKDRYEMLASMYQDQALAGFRAAYNNGGKPDPLAGMVFSALLPMTNFAMPQAEGSLAITGNNKQISDWVVLIRGTRTLIEGAFETLMHSPLRSMVMLSWFPRLDEPPSLTGDNDVDMHLRDLYVSALRLASAAEVTSNQTSPAANARSPDLHSPSAPSPAMTVLSTTSLPLTPEKRRRVYEGAILSLQKCFELVYTLPPSDSKIDCTLVWVTIFPQEYAVLLSEHDQIALVILAHFCVLLSKLDAWWMTEFPGALLRTIKGYLPESWEHWIEWPLSVVKI